MKKQRGKKIPRSVRYRERLADLVGQKVLFEANLGRMSMTSWRASGVRMETLELRSVFISTDPRIVCDHLWVKIADFEDPESISRLKRAGKRKIIFSGIPYSYAEPAGGKGFHSFRERFSIGDMEVLESY